MTMVASAKTFAVSNTAPIQSDARRLRPQMTVAGIV